MFHGADDAANAWLVYKGDGSATSICVYEPRGRLRTCPGACKYVDALQLRAAVSVSSLRVFLLWKACEGREGRPLPRVR